MSKRIAIQLFGHLRSFRVTYKSFIKNIVNVNRKDGYEVDIFIHTWTETDHSTIAWHNPDGHKRGSSLTSEVIDKVKEYYAPKMFLIEEQLDAIDYPLTSKLYGRINSSYKTLLNFTYTIYKSSELRQEYEKENGLMYDYVIVTRPDILFQEPFSIDNILSFYSTSNLTIPTNALYFAYKLNSLFIEDKYNIVTNDVFYFGTEYAIDMGTNLYIELKQKNTIPVLDDFSKDFVRGDLLWLEYWKNQGLEPIGIRYYSSDSKIQLGFTIIRPTDYIKEYRTIMSSMKKIIKSILPYGIVKIIENR